MPLTNDMILRYDTARQLIHLVCVLAFVGVCLSSLTLLRSLPSTSLQLCAFNLFCNNEWTDTLETNVGIMGSQGTASRLRSIARQVRALLTYNHQGPLEVDLLRITAAELQDQLSQRLLTSETLVKQYVDQIEKHNLKGIALHAVTSVTNWDRLLTRARALDEERQDKGPRGPLHGIPVVVKVSTPPDSLQYGDP